MADVFHKETRKFLRRVHTPDYLEGGENYDSGKWLICDIKWYKENSLPTCDPKYWKEDNGKIVEMTLPEKDVINNSSIVKQMDFSSILFRMKAKLETPEAEKRLKKALRQYGSALNLYISHNLWSEVREEIADAVIENVIIQEDADILLTEIPS
jgi:hypothetical protein